MFIFSFSMDMGKETWTGQDNKDNDGSEQNRPSDRVARSGKGDTTQFNRGRQHSVMQLLVIHSIHSPFSFVFVTTVFSSTRMVLLIMSL